VTTVVKCSSFLFRRLWLISNIVVKIGSCSPAYIVVFSITDTHFLYKLPHFIQNSEADIAEIVQPHTCNDYAQSTPKRRLKLFESEETIY